MEYTKHVVWDFATRTRRNLEFVRQAAQNAGKVDPDTKPEVYEVTQLINSMLGLLVFPQQRYFDSVPDTPLSDLSARGWPIPEVSEGFPEVTTLRDLLRYLRNAIAHFNMDFLTSSGVLQGVRVWNTHKGKKTWQADLSLQQLEQLTDCFVRSIEEWVSGGDGCEGRSSPAL